MKRRPFPASVLLQCAGPGLEAQVQISICHENQKGEHGAYHLPSAQLLQRLNEEGGVHTTLWLGDKSGIKMYFARKSK